MNISIVVPIKNEEDFIGRLIESVLRQTYNQGKIELLLVDGKSTDSTIDVINKYEGNENVELIVLNNPHHYTPHALNIGVKAANGELISILGAHSHIEDNYVEMCVYKHQQNEVDCVGGKGNRIGTNFISKIISKAMTSKFGVGNALFRYGNKEQLTDTVAFGTYKQEVFEKIGYFDEELIRAQDGEFNYRLKKHGGKILFCPDIIYYYYSRSGIKKLYKQFNQYGFWKVKLIRKLGGVPSLRHVFPSLFVIFLIGGIALSWFSNIVFFPFITILFIYILLAIYFATKILDKTSFKKVISMLFVYFVMHVSYGLGFIEGVFANLFKKENKSKDILSR